MPVKPAPGPPPRGGHGGNGVSFDKCAEFSDVPGCLKQVICYGQALKVAEEK